MITRHEYKDLVWIDLHSPTNDEIRAVSTEFSVPSVIANDLLFPTLKSHTEQSKNFLYLVLHFPVLKDGHFTPSQEVDFIIGDKVLITTRYENIPVFENFEQVFKVNSILKDEHLEPNSIPVFISLTRQLYHSVEQKADSIQKTLQMIESQIFEGNHKEMVHTIARTGRNILNIKQALDPHQDILHSLEHIISDFAGAKYKLPIRMLSDVYYRSRKHITHLWQTLTELRETNNSLLFTKQNEVMKVFTILAFVTFPLSLFASIFGMNTIATPIVGTQYDFWIVVGLMFIATFIMFIYFKQKHWL